MRREFAEVRRKSPSVVSESFGRVHVRRDGAEPRRERVRVAANMDRHVQRIDRVADEGMIDPRRTPARVRSDVGRNADDLVPRRQLGIRAARVPDASTDRILPTHQPVDERLVHNDDACVRCCLAPVEPATGQHGDAKHVEILGIDAGRRHEMSTRVVRCDRPLIDFDLMVRMVLPRELLGEHHAGHRRIRLESLLELLRRRHVARLERCGTGIGAGLR